MNKLTKFLTIVSASFLITGCALNPNSSSQSGDSGSISSSETSSDSTSNSSSSEETIHVTSVSLNVTEKSLTVDETFELTATVLPENATDKSVTFSSSDNNIASVSSNGLVSALSEGTANITVTTTDGSKTASCSVTVNKKIDPTPTVINVTSVSLNESSKSLTVDDTFQLSATVLPENATNKSMTFSSKDSSVVSVSESGLVSALKAGTTSITVTTVDQNKTATCTFTVADKVVHVSSVSLNVTEKSLTVGENLQLTATVLPENATDKSVTYSSSNEDVASVSSNGLVSALSEGTANITVTTTDGSRAASCSVTVSENKTTTGTVTITSNNTSTETNNAISMLSEDDFVFSGNTSLANFTAKCSNVFPSDDTSYRFSSNKNAGALTISFDSILIKGVSLNLASYGDKNTSVKVNASNNVSQSVTLTSQAAKDYEFSTFSTSSSECTSLTISSAAKNRFYLYSITLTLGAIEPVYPTSISLPTSEEVALNKSKTLTPTVSPSNYNQGSISWSSSDSSIVSVNSGVISGLKEGSATIKASINDKNGASLTASCEVTVTEVAKAAWTIMIYMCGSDLESDSQYGGYATSDLKEILSVKNKPDNVNIIVETGGAKSWKSDYGINSRYLERWEVSNNKLNKVASLTKASMGKSSTFQSFMEWGLSEYPADRTGVIFWNHGGALSGVCYDENFNGDYLENYETDSALNALNLTSKLEFVGYDACLMQVQDVAMVNSQYFNYMVASQESEAGDGWDYDGWLPSIYNNPESVKTETVLTSIVDSFIDDNGGVDASGDYYYDAYENTHYYVANQTLSFLDLSYMDEYYEAWENMASQLTEKVNSSNASTFRKDVIGKTKYFADSYQGEGNYPYFCVFDVSHFLTILSNNSSFNVSGVSSVRTALDKLVVYSSAQTEGAKDAHGLSFSFDIYKSGYSKPSSSNYKFPTWYTFSNTYGGNISSTYKF